VLFDSPTVRNLIFTGAGSIAVANIGAGASGTIGTFADDTPMHVAMVFDIAADRWDIRLDDALLYSDVIGGLAVTSMRFSLGSLGVSEVDAFATSYLDNVSILALDFVAIPQPVPLPGGVWLLLTGLTWIGFSTRNPAVSAAGEA